MNTVNNKRRRESVEKIEKAFVGMLINKELHQISVSDICKVAELNRSTFYANFVDIYDLADKVRKKMEGDFAKVFPSEEVSPRTDGALRLFTHIKENQLFYHTYFKLCYREDHLISVYNHAIAQQEFGNQNMKYHIEFFRNGLNAIIKLWLTEGCQETPEEMARVLKREYRGRRNGVFD